MPLRNRVTPLGEIVAVPERGLVFGNRGCLHDATGRIVRRQASRRWIACRLEFRDRYRRPQPEAGRYTGLFFLDDATALAAGHRPCAECRREDYKRLAGVLGLGGADAIDAQLEHERDGLRPLVDPGTLPDGAFVLLPGGPHLVFHGLLHPWSPGGYGAPRRFAGRVELVTAPSLVRVLAAGWEPLVPFVHPSASE